MTAYREMPKYQRHKQVRALKIKAIARKPNPDPTGRSAASSYGATITPSEDGYGAFDVPPEYMNKHQPEVGGYYVVYEDGYKSYSPAAAFESGYSPRADAHVALPVVDPGPDSLERAMESKTYQDGTTAFGPAPLPDVSPALWAKPLAKEVPELTVSLSDLGLEREIQANSHHSGCKGERCMASAANGYAHSRECIDEAGEAQGWTPTAEDYAKCGPSAGCCGAAPTDSHASAVLYPAIERAMSELGTLHPAFNFAVNRAFNHLHDAFWSECPAPASAAPKRPNFPGV